MKTSVIGLGEVGGGLYAILKNYYDVKWFDKDSDPTHDAEIMHVCIPYSEDFAKVVHAYALVQNPKYIVIHSSVAVGTTKEVFDLVNIPCFHSPIRGKHPDMRDGIETYVKYLSYDGYKDDARFVRNYFRTAGLQCELWENTESTELAKLLELSRYGVYIAFAKEQETICKTIGVDYSTVVQEYERSRNEGMKKLNRFDLMQPVLYPFKDYVGGHCTVEDMDILLAQKEYPLLKTACEIDRNTKIWGQCNIYKTAKIGKGCSIGHGCEIGNNVVVGDGVRIGAMCFIPEGVTIEDGAFIAPKVCFSNDKKPPSNKECWGKTVVRKNATIGMGTVVLPGVEIGEWAMVGAGAVVTKSIPPKQKWYGVPAMPHGDWHEKS